MFWEKIGNYVSDRLFRVSVRDSVIAENQCLYIYIYIYVYMYMYIYVCMYLTPKETRIRRLDVLSALIEIRPKVHKIIVDDSSDGRRSDDVVLWCRKRAGCGFPLSAGLLWWLVGTDHACELGRCYGPGAVTSLCSVEIGL